MLQVTKIIGQTLSSNSYLLLEEKSDSCWLVDIGDCDALIKTLPDNKYISGVFLTHGHFDHINGLNDLKNLFPKCKIFTSDYGLQCLRSEKKNFSYYHERPMSYLGNDIYILHEKDEIKLFDDTILYVMESPGHCTSCLTYYTDNYIFTGDSFIPDVPVVTKLPRGNKYLAQISVERIKVLANAGREICAGHDKENWKNLF